jgi:hypothetical protein
MSRIYEEESSEKVGLGFNLSLRLWFYLIPNRVEECALRSTCFASTGPLSNDSFLYSRFIIFPTISGNLLLARSKPREINYVGFLRSSGSADVSLVELICWGGYRTDPVLKSLALGTSVRIQPNNF